jgi:hypothetical protein
MIVHIVILARFENFVQLVIGQNQLPTFERFFDKLLLEEQ